MYEVIISPRARHDLLEILDYIGDDSAAAAERFSDALLAHTELIGEFPHMGEPIDGRRGVRKVLHTPVRIYYRIDEE